MKTVTAFRKEPMLRRIVPLLSVCVLSSLATHARAEGSGRAEVRAAARLSWCAAALGIGGIAERPEEMPVLSFLKGHACPLIFPRDACPLTFVARRA